LKTNFNDYDSPASYSDSLELSLILCQIDNNFFANLNAVEVVIEQVKILSFSIDLQILALYFNLKVRRSVENILRDILKSCSMQNSNYVSWSDNADNLSSIKNLIGVYQLYLMIVYRNNSDYLSSISLLRRESDLHDIIHAPDSLIFLSLYYVKNTRKTGAEHTLESDLSDELDWVINLQS
jgi:hypothetical protein